MPRTARKKSKTGINHIIFRGINYLDIFLEKDDFEEYIYRLEKISMKYELEIYAYCLMTNHVHLLIKEGIEDISASLKRLGTGYAQWYNKKYRRCGHVFQDRFLNEPVEDDAYLLTVSRYIHMNPVKVGMTQKPEEWKWSSCRGYYSIDIPNSILKRDKVLSCFCDDREKAVMGYKEYMKQENNDKCMEYRISKKSDSEVYEALACLMEGIPVHSLMALEKRKRDMIIAKAKKIEGVPQRQLARVLGVSPNIVFKAK
ncbi:MAG: transposase [Maledivibacter sp.]|jgi:REP element-mobilizing transposase RayT|nr:transposase [Maledivibacter sp.]